MFDNFFWTLSIFQIYFTWKVFRLTCQYPLGSIAVYHEWSFVIIYRENMFLCLRVRLFAQRFPLILACSCNGICDTLFRLCALLLLLLSLIRYEPGSRLMKKISRGQDSENRTLYSRFRENVSAVVRSNVHVCVASIRRHADKWQARILGRGVVGAITSFQSSPWGITNFKCIVIILINVEHS